MMPYLAIGLFGGWRLRLGFDRNERAKVAEAQREAYWDRCTARRDPEFVESLLLIESKAWPR